MQVKKLNLCGLIKSEALRALHLSPAVEADVFATLSENKKLSTTALYALCEHYKDEMPYGMATARDIRMKWVIARLERDLIHP